MGWLRRVVLGASLFASFFANAATWTSPDGVELEYEESNGGAVITKCSLPAGFSGGLEIPSTFGSLPVRSIDDYAFRSCRGLTLVTIPSSVANIGVYAFLFCSGLTSMTIPEGVTRIESSAFDGCSGLTAFRVEENNPRYSSVNGLLLSKDGTTLVRGINGRVIIPEGVTSIGDYAFSGCVGLTSVTIPEGVTSIGISAFSMCSGLTAFRVAENNPRYSSVNGLLLSKDGTTLVRGINGRVVIPEGVTSIGDYAFTGCSGLTSVTIPDSVTNIKDLAFYGCSGLTSVTIPASVTNIGEMVFAYCGGLRSFVVAANSHNYSSMNGLLLSKDGKTLLYGVNGNVTIPYGVTDIGYRAFSGCWGLMSVTIPASVTSIGNSAFGGCNGLASVTIPEGVTNIGDYAFYSCGLTSVTIPGSVTSIGNWAFGRCNGLASVSIQNGVTNIGDYAFLDCKLTSVTIPASVTSIGNSAFKYCMGLTSVTIQNGVTNIGDYAFYGCSGLMSVTIPESVTSVGDEAFAYCIGLTSVTIPASVTNFGKNVFYGCANLSLITFKGAPPAGTDWMDLVPGDGIDRSAITVQYDGSQASAWREAAERLEELGFAVEMYSALPDLAVAFDGFAPTSWMPGDTVTVVTVESNIGDGIAVVPWIDRLILDDGLGVQTVLKTWQVSEDLASGKSVSRCVSCVIPELVPLEGSVYLGLHTDIGESVAEVEEVSNNVCRVGGITLGKRLYLTAASTSVVENAAMGVRFTVKRSGSTADPLTVMIRNANTNTVSAPAIVTIPAGSAAVNFTVKPIDNAVVDGTRVVNMSVAANGYAGASVPLTVLDNEMSKLTVMLDKTSIREGDGVITVTVFREGSTEEDLTVYLSGTSSGRVSYPSSVIIPAGESSVTFEISVPDNDTAQVAQDLTLRASSAGYQPASVSYRVEDDDVPGVTLSLAPEVVSENAGARAIYATLTRSDTNQIAKAVRVRLTASEANQLILPSEVTIPKYTMAVRFAVGVVDNALDDGDREVTINGAIVIESCGCNGQPSNGDVIQAVVGIIDDDGPALALKAEPATMKEGLAPAGYLVLSHNSTLTEDLTVRLWVDAENESEVEIPESVMIPVGETSVRIPVTTLDDGVEDGSKLVSVYAEVDGETFAPASTWVLVTDQNLPDLVPVDIALQSAAVTVGERISLTFAITNAGYAASSRGVAYSVYCVKGKSATVGDAGILVASGTTDAPVGIGTLDTVATTITVPDVTGDCRFAVVVDPEDVISELDNANNTAYSAVISVSPSYIVQASVAEETFLKGAEVTISGIATKSVEATPAANVAVEVYVLKDGLRRTLMATTDAQGRFSVTFKPTSSEAGHYIVGASFPGMGATAEQDSFDILGMKRTSGAYMEWYMTVGEEKTLTTSIANMSPVPLTGVEVEIVGIPPECSADASIAETIAGSALAMLSVTLKADGVSGGDKYKSFVVRITSREGAVLEVPLYFYAKSAKALLKATPASIEATMTIGVAQTVRFTITNVGSVDSGPVEVKLPQLPWMKVVSGGEAANLSSQDSMTVDLEIVPSQDMTLNYTYTPRIAVNCENGDGIVIPCRLTPVAGADGGIRLSVMEKYSLTAGYAMPVPSATIQVKNKYTGEIVASGVSGPDGAWKADGIAAGEWVLYVTAPYHAAYTDEIVVQAERTVEKTVLMDTEAVSAYWKEFKRVDVEDETDIDLVCEYVTTVPQPVVVIKECPSELPPLGEGESTAFNIVAVNEGWIAAQDAHLDLPELEGYEWRAQQDIGLVPAGASVTVPVVLTRKTVAPIRPQRLAAASKPKVICKFVLRVGYFWDCGWDRKWAAFPKLMKFQACFEQPDGKDVPKPPSTPDPRPIGPELPREREKPTAPSGGDDPPKTVEIKGDCNPCVMGRGYALIDVVTEFFTGIASHDITEEDVKNLKEMGLSDDSDLMETLRYFGYGKNVDTEKSVGEYSKEMAASMLKEGVKWGARLNNIMEIVGKENNKWTNPNWSPTLAKIGNITKSLAALQKALSALSLVTDSLDALLSPEHCAHLNLTPFIDSSGNVNEDLQKLMDERYEFVWEESASAVKSFAASSGMRLKADVSNTSALMNPDVPKALWSGLLKFEVYRLQVCAYGDILKALFPANTVIGDPSFGQIATCMAVLDGHMDGSSVSHIDVADFDEIEASGDGNALSSEESTAFVENWNALVAAYESGEAQVDGASITGILKNFRIMAQAERVARSLGYWSVGHMISEEKPLLLETIDKESGSVCASVKLKISQTVRMTREAFEGVLEIGNSSTASPITNIRLIPIITDDAGVASDNLFAFSQIGSERLSGESILDGGMSLGAAQTGVATIRFVPGVDAAPTVPKTYRFGGLLVYVNPFTGVQETKEIMPVAMTVNPSPLLALDYFIQRDVIGDDPFTADVVEPSVPAEIALVVRNKGYGDARDVTMKTAAPRILENTKGLLADFTLTNERCALNGVGANIGLSDVRLGTIPAQGQSIAQWWLSCSVQGHFKDFDASFTHRTSYGETVANMSLVESVNVHSLIKSIDADGDVLPDFLVCEHGTDGTPDTIFSGIGGEESVVSSLETTCGIPDDSLTMRLSVVPRMAGWNYATCIDGGDGQFTIAKIVREDGSELSRQNVWLTDRTFNDGGDPKHENRIHIIDRFSDQSEVVYTLYLTSSANNSLRIASFGQIEDGSVQGAMPDSISVAFSRPISHETFDLTDITLRRQGVKIDDINSLSITRIDSAGCVYSINGLRSVSSADGTYTLTVQTAQIADDRGIAGVSGKSIMWTVISGAEAPPSVGALKIAPDYGSSDNDGITYGTDFTLMGTVNREGTSVQILARYPGIVDAELWRGIVSGSALSVPIRLTTGGDVTLVVVVTDGSGNVSETVLPVFIDTVPITGALTGAADDEGDVTASATLAFSAQVMDVDVTLDKFSLTRDGEPVALAGVTINKVNETTFTLVGLDTLCAEDGAYALRFDGSAVRKYTSGLTMGGSLAMRWRHVSPDCEPPTITAVLFDGEVPQAVYTNMFSSVSITFSESVNMPELIANGLIGKAARIDLLDAANVVTSSVMAVSAPTWDAASNTLAWQIDPLSVSAGMARLVVDAGLVTDEAGNGLSAAGFDAASGLRRFEMPSATLAQVTAQAMPMWSDGSLYVGEKTAGNTGKIRCYAADGTWTYLQSEGVDIEIPAQGCQGASVAFADLDGDGKAEIYVGTAGGDVLKYPGGETVASLGVSRAVPFACDLDGDGCDELFVGGMDGRIRVISRDAESGVCSATLLLASNGLALTVPNGRAAPVVADVNHDGYADILSGDTAGNVWAYLGDGTSWCAQPVTVFTNDVSLADRSRLGLGDVDGDGIEDLVIGRSDGSVAAWLGVERPSPIVPFERCIGLKESYGPFVPGEQVSIDIPLLVGYSAKGLPSGLKFDSKTGKVTGAATKPTAEEGVKVSFTKKGEETLTTQFIVGPFPVLTVDFDLEMGKVTGAGAYTAGKKVTLKVTAAKGYVFAGWYTDAAFENRFPEDGSIDWRTPSMPYVAGAENAALFAKFVKVEDDAAALLLPPVKAEYAPKENVEIALDVSGCVSLPTVKVTGLPPGLKFTAKALDVKATKTAPAAHYKANTIYGAPTKSGVYATTITVTTAGKKTVTETVTFVVVDSEKGEHVLKIASDAEQGKVTGAGVYAAGKKVALRATAAKGFVFAGWYKVDGSQLMGDGSVDWRTPSITYMMPDEDVQLEARFVPASDSLASEISLLVDGRATTEKASETVFPTSGALTLPLEVSSASLPKITLTGLPAGLKFTAKALDVKVTKTASSVHYDANTIYGTAAKPGTYVVTAKITNATVKKAVERRFTIAVDNLTGANDRLAVTDADGSESVLKNARGETYTVYVGVAKHDLPLIAVIPGAEKDKVTLAGLPTGLKYDAKTGKITGVATKAGLYTVTVTVRSGRDSFVSTFTIEVVALPEWAVGTFVGMGDKYSIESYKVIDDNLYWTFTVSANGKISGKALFDTGEGRLLTATFSAPSFATYDDIGGHLYPWCCFDIDLVFKDRGRVVQREARRVYIERYDYEWYEDAGAEDENLQKIGYAQMFRHGDEEFTSFSCQNVWKIKGFELLPQFAARKTVVTKTCDIHGDPEVAGTSTLTLEIGSNGMVNATLVEEGNKGGKPFRKKTVAKGDLVVSDYSPAQAKSEADTFTAGVELVFGNVGLLDVEVKMQASPDDGKIYADGCEITYCTDFADWNR